jgi:hypothetical protein
MEQIKQIEHYREMLNVPQLARESGMSKGCWRTLNWLKQIEYAKVGRSVRVSRRAFDAYLAARSVQPVMDVAA